MLAFCLVINILILSIIKTIQYSIDIHIHTPYMCIHAHILIIVLYILLKIYLLIITMGVRFRTLKNRQNVFIFA